MMVEGFIARVSKGGSQLMIFVPKDRMDDFCWKDKVRVEFYRKKQ